MTTMAKLNFEEETRSVSIPGESWAHEPGSLPFDRPPETSNANAALHMLFKSLMRPTAINKTLDALRNDVALDDVSVTLVKGMWMEGKIPPQLMPIITPAVTVMIRHMADTAGVPFKTSEDFRINEATQISEEDLDDIEDAVEDAGLVEKKPEAPEQLGQGEESSLLIKGQ